MAARSLPGGYQQQLAVLGEPDGVREIPPGVPPKVVAAAANHRCAGVLVQILIHPLQYIAGLIHHAKRARAGRELIRAAGRSLRKPRGTERGPAASGYSEGF